MLRVFIKDRILQDGEYKNVILLACTKMSLIKGMTNFFQVRIFNF
jgi:hypothetical protein